VISVKEGLSGSVGGGTRETGACSFCRRHSRLVGESAWARAFARDDALLDHLGQVLLEGLRAFGQERSMASLTPAKSPFSIISETSLS
jgi:hypothetical protein